MTWTVSGYLIGFSLGQLLWGRSATGHGRRLPMAIGLVLFVIGSAGCALAGNVWAMIGWRVVQAVGACAGVVLARAMVRDLFEGDRAAQMLSTLMIVMAIAPLWGRSWAVSFWRWRVGERFSGCWSASASQHSRRCSHYPRRCRPSGVAVSR